MKLIKIGKKSLTLLILSLCGDLSAQPFPPVNDAPINDYIPHLIIIALVACSLYIYLRKRQGVKKL